VVHFPIPSLTMEAQTYQYVYWVFSTILLSLGGALLAVVGFFMSMVEIDVLYLAFLPMLMGDVATVLNFLPRDVRNIIAGNLDTSGWCHFSAFWAIACCVALNFNATTIAYCTKKMITNNLDREGAKQKVIFSTILGWGVGIMLASGFVGSKKTGGFKGLYCCLERITGIKAALPVFVINGISSLIMVKFYYDAFYTADEAHRRVAHALSIDTSSRKSSTSGSGSVQKPEHIRGLMFLGFYMVSSFYVCWTLVCILAILEAGGVTYPVELDMLAAWCLKLQPIFDSVILLRGLQRLLSRRLGGSRQGNQNHSNENLDKSKSKTKTPKNADKNSGAGAAAVISMSNGKTANVDTGAEEQIA
jgi:hypothetical protein